MSIGQFFAILWARRAFVFVTTAAALLGAAFVILLLPPRYEAKSRVMLNFIKPDPVTGEVISSSFARTYTKTQTELIRDYRVAGQVVDKLGLAGNPELQAEFAELPVERRTDFRRWLAGSIIAHTDAELVPGTNILEISYRSAEPEIARIVADALRDAYVDSNLSARREEARRNAEWFEGQAAEARAKLAEAETTKAAFEKANNIILQQDNNDIDSLRLAALAGTSTPVTAAPQPAMGGASPMSAELAQIDAAIASAAARLGPNHPQMQALRKQRALTQAQLARERAAASAGAAQAAQAGTAIISQEVARQRAKVIGQRDKLAQLRKLKDEADLQRSQLEKLNERMNALQQESEAGQAGLTSLGSAVTPASPYFPNVPLILLGALGFGAAIGALSGLLFELLNRRIRSEGDIVNGFDMPLLAVMTRPEGAGPKGVAARLRQFLLPRHGISG